MYQAFRLSADMHTYIANLIPLAENMDQGVFPAFYSNTTEDAHNFTILQLRQIC